jgi:hypothetical protein
MISSYYVTADERQAIFDAVINVGILNIDTVLIGNTNLKFVKINLSYCHTVLHELRPNFPNTGPLSANGKSGVWPPGLLSRTRMELAVPSWSCSKAVCKPV